MHHLISLSNRDFFFKLKQINLIFYIYLVDASIIIMLIKNDLNQIVKIFKKIRFDII